MYQLGYIYNQGIGVDIDYEKARIWYEKAAILGCSDAQCNLGYLYQEGLGIEKNYEEAIKWYEKQ